MQVVAYEFLKILLYNGALVVCVHAHVCVYNRDRRHLSPHLLDLGEN